MHVAECTVRDAHNVAAKGCFPRGVERSSRDGSTTSDMDAYLRRNRGAGHPSTYPRDAHRDKMSMGRGKDRLGGVSDDNDVYVDEKVVV